MADFLLTEAVDEDPKTIDEDEGNIINMTLSDEEFIDDSSVIEESVSDYYGFTNVSREYDDAIQDSFSGFDYNQEANNYCNDDDELFDEIDEFKDFKSRVEKFKKTLINPQGFNNENSFFYSILYTVRYHLTNKFDDVDDEQIKVDIGAEIYDKIHPLKNFLKLDLDILNFENQCLTINRILSKNGLFLRVFELKDKFHFVIKQGPEKKNIIRELSGCIIEKFNGFTVVRIEFDRKLRQKFSPIDIIYKPVKKEDEIIECFFSEKMNLAYRTTYSEDKKNDIKTWYCFSMLFLFKLLLSQR